MNKLPEHTLKILEHLQSEGINPVLYGSQGVSLYIGAFEHFGDVDLLIDDMLLNKDWGKLVLVMKAAGFRLLNLHEHEFVNPDDTHVSFASKNIIVRDGIAKSIVDVLRTINISGIVVQTISPIAFLKAYEFSVQDGYRKEVRGKKDAKVIALLGDYLKKAQDR